ncbi:MAG: hypothetical protein ACYTBX_20510, partial [Planctomycetota bacterium]
MRKMNTRERTVFIVVGLAFVLWVAQVGAIEVVRKKNAATYIIFPITDSTGTLISSAAGLDSELDEYNDGTAPNGFTDCTNEATEVGSTGQYYLSLANTEVDDDYTIIQVKSTSAGALTQTILIRTQTGDPQFNAVTDDGTAINVASGVVEGNMVQISGDTEAADSLEEMADGYDNAQLTNREVLATLSTVTTAEVNTQADLALSDIGLDHLIAVADGDDPVNGSIIAEMTSATEDWSTFSAANNSLEALRTRGDNAWITGAGSDSVTTLRWVNLAVWGLTMDPDSSATADRNVNVRFWDDAEITDGNSWPDVDIADVVSGVIDADAIGADAIGTSEWDNAVTNAINNLIWGDTSGAGVRGQLFLETYRNAENINYRADDEYSADHNYFNHPYVMDPGDLWNDFEAVGDWTLVSNSDSTVVAEETTNVKEGSKSVRLTSKNEYPASAMWTLPNPHIYYFNNCGIQYYVDPEYTPYFTDYPCSTSLEYVRIKFLTGDSVITDNDTTHYFEQEWLSFNVASGWNAFQWCRDSMVASDAVASWDSTLMAIKIEVNSKTDAGASYGTEWASVCFDNLRMDIVSKTIAQLRIDDGYKDVFDNAYLPLKARGIQGICMIPTQSVDELVEDIDLDDMRVMAADGWQFATHAHSSRAFGFVSGLDGD